MTDDISVVFGTRPEAIKLGPVVAELQALGRTPQVVCTGQHTDLLRGTPAETDLSQAVSLGLVSDGNVPRWLTRAQQAVGDWLALKQPKVLVVQGDTMTVQAAAHAAVALDIPVLHVEAGLRSHNLRNPWPEEVTRVTVSKLATWHYAPTSTSFANLVAEGVRPLRIQVTGNTVVSALARYAPDVRPTPAPEATVVVTMHRREVQTPEMASMVYRELYKLAMHEPHLRVVWPMHPGFARWLGTEPEMPPNVTLAGPMPYRQFVGMLAKARLVITDSGGLVEEAATLGVPTVIWRDSNDRPEAVASGIAVTCSLSAGALAHAFERACGLHRLPTVAFGGAEAASLVARHICQIS